MPKQGGHQVRIVDKKRNKVISLQRDGKSQGAIAKELDISRGGVRGILARDGLINYFNNDKSNQVMSLLRSGLEAKEVAEKTGLTENTIYTISFYNREREKATPVKDLVKHTTASRLQVEREWGPGRYMLVADFHIMFHNQQVLEQCLSIKGDFDGCIILGDFIDEFWISYFRKELASSHHSEVDAGTFIIEALTKRFGRVLYIQGNHEDRRWKQLLEAIKPVADLAEGKADEVYDFVDRRIRNWYFNGLPNVNVVNHWFTTIAKGRVIVSHPDRFMKVPGQAPKEVLEHFYGHRKDYKLGDIDALFMGHTHRMSGPTHRMGVWTMEVPCMSGILPYQAGSKASNAGTVDTGYFVLTTKPDGSMWFNESRSYLLEE